MAHREAQRSPEKVREIFGENLKSLTRSVGSVSHVCRELGINRAQFNRYLSSEAHPRPDVLEKICGYFGTDARILLAPLGELRGLDRLILGTAAEIGPFAARMRAIDPGRLPDGFYRFMRMVEPDLVLVTLVSVKTGSAGVHFANTMIPKSVQRRSGGSLTRQARRVTGIAMQSGDGIGILFLVPEAETLQYTFLDYSVLGSTRLFVGFSAVGFPGSAVGARIMPAMLDRLDGGLAAAIRFYRTCGMRPLASCPELMRDYLANWHRTVLVPAGGG